MKNNSYVFSLFLIGLFFASCQQPLQQPKKTKLLPDYFQKTMVADTMLFELKQEEDELWTDTIPNSLLFTQMETHIMNGVDYIDNSGDLIVIGRSRFPIQENKEAFLVEMRQNWYRHLSLFIFDEKTQAFTERETVAEFYGGEGGQILTGSWLTDFDGDGDKDLIRREIEHWLILDDDNTRDTTSENAHLLLWEGNGFLEGEVDSAELVKQFPITNWW